MVPSQDAVAIIRDHVDFDPTKLKGEDFPSWKRLAELPTAVELLDPAATTNDVPLFPIDKPFPSKDHYLEALYKILRFEGIEGLRYSVNDFRLNPTIMDDQNTCVYTKVCFTFPPSLSDSILSHRAILLHKIGSF